MGVYISLSEIRIPLFENNFQTNANVAYLTEIGAPCQ